MLQFFKINFRRKPRGNLTLPNFVFQMYLEKKQKRKTEQTKTDSDVTRQSEWNRTIFCNLNQRKTDINVIAVTIVLLAFEKICRAPKQKDGAFEHMKKMDSVHCFHTLTMTRHENLA